MSKYKCYYFEVKTDSIGNEYLVYFSDKVYSDYISDGKFNVMLLTDYHKIIVKNMVVTDNEISKIALKDLEHRLHDLLENYEEINTALNVLSDNTEMEFITR